jgi:flagellar biosynthesis/type III secretory pathway protein FliH
MSLTAEITSVTRAKMEAIIALAPDKRADIELLVDESYYEGYADGFEAGKEDA